jgi:general stress protein 26
MTMGTPVAELDQRYSGEGASATDWAEGRRQLEEAQLYWLVTVRPDGRPHVAPLISASVDGARFFSTGDAERKAKNLAENPHCILLTGTNTWDTGPDVVVEGDARMVTDEALLQRVADAYVAKYGEAWRFTVRDGAFFHGEGSVREEHTNRALVYEIVPTTAFGFGRGATFSQTRWRF